MKKIVLIVFNADPMCFIHVLLNALDMQARTIDCRVIIEGAALISTVFPEPGAATICRRLSVRCS